MYFKGSLRLMIYNNVFIGIDIGTSSVKAVIFSKEGLLVHQETEQCQLISLVKNQAELDPNQVFQSVITVVARCMKETSLLKSSIEGIGLSCHMHNIMAVDKEGKPLTNVFTWADNRSIQQADEIGNLSRIHELCKKTGCRIQHPMYPVSKLLWLKQTYPELYERSDRFVSLKEFIVFKLYREWLVDYTTASAEGFYDIYKQRWSEYIIKDLLGISSSRLSHIVPCTHMLTNMLPEWSGRMGIHCNTPLVIGSGDGIMANLGCGVFNTERFSSTIGTSGAVRTTVRQPLSNENNNTWCYSFTEDRWVVGGAINNGGIALTWLRQEFGQQYEKDIYNGERLAATMDRMASEIPAGCEGLLFLPYLLGERCPDWNAEASGSMYGLKYVHNRNHITRAIMEGVMYRLYTVDAALTNLCGSSGVLIANGGYAYSDFWLQMQADMFGRDVYVSGVTEASALGAAYLAMFAVGAVPSLEYDLPEMKPVKVLKPNTENMVFYDTWKAKAGKYYQHIKELDDILK